MTLRWLALGLAAALALPAVALLLRSARTYGRGEIALTALPVGLLAALVGFAVAAG